MSNRKSECLIGVLAILLPIQLPANVPRKALEMAEGLEPSGTRWRKTQQNLQALAQVCSDSIIVSGYQKVLTKTESATLAIASPV